jgi:hypothetical protein
MAERKLPSGKNSKLLQRHMLDLQVQITDTIT